MESILLASNIALWVVAIAQALFILVLFHYIGLLLNRVPPEGLPLEQKAPKQEIQDIDGKRYVLGERSDRGRILIFTSPLCPWCEKLAPDIPQFVRSVGHEYDVLAISAIELDSPDARAYANRLDDGSGLKLAVAPQLLERYLVRGTPYGMLLDEDGAVRAKGVTNSLTDLQTIVNLR